MALNSSISNTVFICCVVLYDDMMMMMIMIYLLTAIWFSPGGSTYFTHKQ